MLKTPLLTKRLSLRSFYESDMTDTLSILTNDCVKQTYMLPDFQCPSDAIPLFHKLKELSIADNHYVFAVCLNDKVIGFMNDVEINDSKIEIGYVIHPDHQNQGYATEALTALIDHLHTMGFHTVTAGYFCNNAASGRVMEKAGMTKADYEDDIEYRGKLHHCLYFESKRHIC